MEQHMSDILMVAVQYTGYISIIKLVAFIVLFVLWMALLSWVQKDSDAIGAEPALWTSLTLGIGAVAAILWLLLPLFIMGLLFYLLAVGITAIAYVKHRNSRVLEYERVLTADHIKGLFSKNKEGKADSPKNFLFVTANKNEIPMPMPKTPDFYGYKISYDIFNDAQTKRATSIVMAPTPQDYSITYEIDGAAIKQPEIDKDQVKYLIHFIKNLADLDTKEKRKPQKGHFSIKQGKDSIEWIVNTAGSTAGERVQFNVVEKLGEIKLEDINLMSDQFEAINKISEVNEGLFLITGPAKSGVTTTFYALLKNHDAFLNSIDILEKQPSAELPNITQNTYTLSDTGTTTYAKKFRSIVRMGPDIVGLADCEDSESAKLACQAAKDAKIVYVTLKSDSLQAALGKWIKLVGNVSEATESLLGISNQRLVRRLCEECKEAYKPNAEVLRKFNLSSEKTKILYRPGKVIYDKHGKPSTCEDCQGTGFMGRTAVFETLMLSDNFRKALKQIKTLADIGKLLRSAKMLFLQQRALRFVIDGMTAINEMVRVFSASKPQKQVKK
jgi:type II secretory ATPase GspE/PulE/Tfp pilus assembly ATPase PilB-like protein